MSFNKSNWNRKNWDNRGRGGRGRGGVFHPSRGSWGPCTFRVPQQFDNPGYWSKWNQDYSGPGNRHINQQWQNRAPRDTPGKRLSEEDIGVTEFVSDHEGFSGIIKSRYSDFQVSEINEEGEVAQLTNLTPPDPPNETFDEDEDLLLTKYNLEILPMDTWDSINKLVVSKEPAEKVEIDVTGMTKEQRTKIHDAVKKAFGNAIVGSTVNVDNKKLVCFDRYRKGVRIDNRVKWIWPGEYVYFIVHKENCDTMDAAIRIAEALRINLKASMLGYAGTKDRRAKTSQWFSARRVDPRRLHHCAPQLKQARLRIGNYCFRANPLRLGMLQGNKFRIALRNVTASEEVVSAACELLRTRGFINYYGLQRFGTRVDAPTYRVGLQLLQSKFKQAIDSILSEERGTGRRPAHESRIMRSLKRAPRDYVGALQKVPRNTRLLYVHSYQSLVWNRVVTERIRRFGLVPRPGDLVPLGNIQHEDVEDEEDDEDEEGVSEKDDQEDTAERQEETEKEPKAEAESQKKTDKEKKGQKTDAPKPKVPVKILTQEDIDSGNYTIFDIIMPLPGYNIDYPPNMKDYYEELITKDGLTLELKNKIKGYSMSGAYRRVVALPEGVSWELVGYSDPHADLLLSDADQLDGRQLTGIIEDGKYKALLLTMSLPASCYATMALRELLKVDTSGDNQALQNNYHKRKRENSTTEKDDNSATNQEGMDSEDKIVETNESERENGEKGNEDEGGTEAKKAKTEDSDKQ